MRSCRLRKCNLFYIVFDYLYKRERILFKNQVSAKNRNHSIVRSFLYWNHGRHKLQNENQDKESLTDSEIKIICIQNYGYTSSVVCFIQMNQN